MVPNVFMSDSKFHTLSNKFWICAMMEIEFIQLISGSNYRYLLTVLNLQPVSKCAEIKPVQGLFLVKE
jgi:hypothetical protein